MSEPTRKSATKKTVHWHGCQRCHTGYEDNCTTKTVDGLCIACRGGRAWQLLIDSRAPRPCCQAARLVTKEQRETYRLAGGHLWFICPVCARTHPYDPKNPPARDQGARS